MAQALLTPATTLIVTGGSAGSLDVLLQLISHLSLNGQTALIIILHRKNDATTTLLDLLCAKSGTPVKEAEDKEPILGGRIYLAPADYHLLIEEDHTFSLDYSEKVNYSRPSIDVTFETAAYSYGRNLICVLLSGANTDGTNGLKTVKEQQGIIIIQQPESAGVPFMPQYAINHLTADHIVTPELLTPLLQRLLQA